MNNRNNKTSYIFGPGKTIKVPPTQRFGRNDWITLPDGTKVKFKFTEEYRRLRRG